MSFTYIKGKVEALGPIYAGAEVPVDLNLTGSAELIDRFQDAFDAESFTIKGYYCDLGEDYIHITGTVDLLYQTDLECVLLVRDLGDRYSFYLQLLVPGGWRFSHSFGELPTLPSRDKENADARTLADCLRLSTSYLYFYSEGGYNADAGMELVAGLSFKGEVEFNGVWRYLEELAGISWPIVLSGPVKEYLAAGEAVKFTGLRLAADIPLSVDLGSLTASSARLLLKLPVRTSDWEVDMGLLSDPGIYVLVDTEVGGRPCQLVSVYEPLESHTLSLAAVFTDFAIAGLSDLDGTVGGPGMESAAPSEMGSPSGVQLIRIEAEVDLEERNLSSIELEVGCANTWELAPGWLTLTQVGLIFTVSHPFESKLRRIDVGVRGWMEVNGAALSLRMSYPRMAFGLDLMPGNPLSLGELMEALAPGMGELPAVNIDALNIDGSVHERRLALNFKGSELARFKVGEAECLLSQLGVAVDHTHGGGTKGSLSARLTLGDASCQVGGALATSLVLSGTLKHLSLHALFASVTGSTDIPEELPDLELSLLAVTYNHGTGGLKLEAEAQLQYDRLPFDMALEATLVLEVERIVEAGKPARLQVEVGLSGTGPVSFAKGFSLSTFNLLFGYDSQGGWSLGGTFDTLLCDHAVTLSALYANTPQGKRFALSGIATEPIAVLHVDGMFQFSWSRTDLKVETIVEEGKPDKRSWSLRMDTWIDIPGAASFGGMLEFSYDTEGKRLLRIRPVIEEAYAISVADGVGMTFSPYELVIGTEGTMSGGGQDASEGEDSPVKGWLLTGTVIVSVTGVPGKLGKVMPSETWGVMTLGKAGVSVELYGLTAPWSFPLPKAGSQALGRMVLEMRYLGLSLGKKVGISAEFGIGFPAELNTYFRRQVFREYVEGDPMSMARIKVTLATKGGTELKFLTSPFLSGNTNSLNGEDWLSFDFGEYGGISMKLPSFAYNMSNSYFEAAGGFRIDRDLYLPLTPLRNFLDGVGLSAAKAIFPEKLPIKGVSLVDGNNNFKTEDLIKLLGEIPEEVKKTLRGAGNLLDRFPDSFKSYLRFTIPTDLEFKYGFSPAGRVSLSLLAPKEPIRFLYPGMVQGLVPMPGLIGIELRKLTVGTLASGTLFVGEVDGIVDLFDLPGLVASLALPSDPGFPLPTSDQLQRRILLRNVFSVIPMSQGLPVPVPVFYDELGFEYKGIEGMGLGVHLGLPQPDFASGGTALLQTLGKFFTDRNYKLDPGTAPGGQQIKFQFHDEFLEAPEYLGGGKVGTTGKMIEVGTWKYVASLMNFCKRFVLTDIVGAIPVEHRSMNKTAKLGPFEVEGTYLVTTLQEFDGGAYGELQLTSAQARDFKAVLPGVQLGESNGSSGLIMFLRGAVKASSVFDLQASFGLAAGSAMGFGTGFKLYGKLGGFVEAELRGCVLLNAPELGAVGSGTGGNTGTTGGYVVPSYPAANAVALPISSVVKPYSHSHGLALRLNGSSSQLKLPYPSTLGNKVFTVEAWVNIEAFTTDRITLLGRPGNQWRLNVLKGGQLEYAGRSVSSTAQVLRATSNAVLSFGAWTHVAMSWDGKHIRIFVNAVNVGSFMLMGIINDTSGLVVGKDLAGSSPDFIKGWITDLRLWRYPRSAEELADGMHTRPRGDEPNLVSYYPLDGDNQGMAYDAVGLGHGTITDPKYDLAAVHAMAGLDFDGDGDYVSIPALGNFVSGGFVVEVLLRADRHNDGSTRGILGSNSTPELATDLVADQYDSTIRMRPGKFYSVMQGVTPQGKGQCFLNGVYVCNWNAAWSSTPGTIRLDLGKSGRQGLGTFKGRIYELRVYGVKWGEGSVLVNYNKYRAVDDANLLAHFKLGKAKNGVVLSERGDVEAKVYVKPRLEKLQFDGARFSDPSHYGHLPKSDKYCGSGAYTVEAWIKPEVVDTNSRFIVRGIQYAPRVAMQNGQLSLRWYDAANGFKQMDSATNLIKAGEWQHIAVAHDGSLVSMYINGVLVKSRSFTGGLQKGATELAVGRRELTKAAENFLGSIDELRFWNRALTGTEISKYMQYRLSGNEAGLVAYYPVNLLDAEGLQDYGPNRLHGKLVGITRSLVPVATVTTGTSTSSSPATRKRVQALGHSHLKVGGREVMVADMRLNDDEFWFKGVISLFPPESKLKVGGTAEALIKKDSLYLYADSEVALFGMTLSKSKLLLTHTQMRIEGEFLGIHTLLDVAWSGSDPRFTGRIWASYSRTFEIGAVYIKGVRMCDNYSINLNVGFDIGLDINKTAFKANIAATFMIAGVGFDFSFTLGFAPTDLSVLGDYLRDELAANAWKYFSHVFTDALNYITDAVGGALEFMSDNFVQLGQVLSGAFVQGWNEVCNMWNSVGGSFESLYEVLRGPFGVGLQEMAGAFNQLGAGIDELGALFDGFDCTMNEICDALINGAGATLEEAIASLKKVGRTISEVGNGLQSVMQGGWNEFTAAMNKYFDPGIVARLLKMDFAKTADQVAGIYKAISMELEGAYDALSTAFGTGISAVKAFRQAGYVCDQVSRMIKRYHDALASANILAGSGYSTDEITGSLKNVWNYSKDQAESLLKQVVGDLEEIGRAIKKWFG